MHSRQGTSIGLEGFLPEESPKHASIDLVVF